MTERLRARNMIAIDTRVKVLTFGLLVVKLLSCLELPECALFEDMNKIMYTMHFI